ncbi:MAG TPA: alpha/beta fold hydrolase [Actinocrinis sp.]|nr:alpha/beta fold hydrolase [Actinocrinis sp.]
MNGYGEERRELRFTSNGVECAAWHYPGSNGACVIMTSGFAMPKEPGTDRFARRFHEAGFSVLAFDYRRLGGSGGRPRGVATIKDQVADWRAALAFARTLPGVDAGKIAIWSFSLPGGYIVQVAAQEPGVAAAIAQSPNLDGQAATRNAMRFTTPLAMLRLTARGVLDALGGLVGRAPLLVPTSGPRGIVALLSTPDSLDGTGAIDPDGEYPDWQQVVAARSTLRAGLYRPGRFAAQVRCPLLIVACDGDQSALAAPAVRAAGVAPRGELLRVPGGHYAPFLDAHEEVVAAEVAFLRRHLAVQPSEGKPLAG